MSYKCCTCLGCGRLYNDNFPGTDDCNNYIFDGGIVR